MSWGGMYSPLSPQFPGGFVGNPAGGGGGGDVVGPAAAVDNDISVYDGVTGKLIKDSGVTVAGILASIPTSTAAPWTPTIIAPVGAAAGYLDQTGTYYQIGRLLVASFNVQLNGVGTLAGNISVGGLPVAINAGHASACVSIGWSGFTTPLIGLMAGIFAGASSCLLFQMTIAATGSFGVVTQPADLAANSIVRGTLIYRTA